MQQQPKTQELKHSWAGRPMKAGKMKSTSLN